MTTTSALENISSFIPLLHSWETLKSFFLEIERANVGAGGCKVMKETLLAAHRQGNSYPRSRDLPNEGESANICHPV